MSQELAFDFTWQVINCYTLVNPRISFFNELFLFVFGVGYCKENKKEILYKYFAQPSNRQVIMEVVHKNYVAKQKKDKKRIRSDLIESASRRKFEPKLLILDELDVIRQHKEILYNIFDWTIRVKACFVVVVVSNFPDLANTFDKTVCSRVGSNEV